MSADMLVKSCLVLLSILAATASAQTTARERAATLRVQLAEVETKQAGVQTRLRQLEEDLKPENIEKALAGFGSTHPEEVREQRRRQLQIEQKGLQTQLDLLSTSHTRLETSIAQADADAYRESAGVSASGTTASTATQPSLTTKLAVSPKAQAGSSIARRRSRRVKRTKSRPRRISRATRTGDVVPPLQLFVEFGKVLA